MKHVAYTTDQAHYLSQGHESLMLGFLGLLLVAFVTVLALWAWWERREAQRGRDARHDQWGAENETFRNRPMLWPWKR